ncbi:MAG TPA: MinD/ParA family protein [Phototrophicaceae bacterium]|nr:MinD/ParA family protein [Phototrophicaceae bacterium]
MPEIISVHSFRGGTGKSNLVANMGTLLARQGKRVGIMDTDIQSPGVHVLFGVDETKERHTLNEYLWSNSTIEEAAIALHEINDAERPFLKDLRMWLIPASVSPNDIAKVIRQGYDVNLLQRGFHRLVQSLELDYLLIDTHPGLDEETLLAIAMSHTLVIVLRTDRQDVHGTAVTIEIARKLDVPNIRLAVNKVPTRYDFTQIKREMETTYNVPVAGLLPLSEDVAAHGSSNVFCVLYPEHPWSRAVTALTQQIVGTPT